MITSATKSGATATISGTAAAGVTSVEVYRAVGAANDQSGGNTYGEGVQYLGTAAVAAGSWTLNFTDGSVVLNVGDAVSAIAIDNPATTKNTSEFSRNVVVVSSDASEGFNDPVGTLNGQGGGTNFAGTWTQNQAGAATVVNPGMVDPTGTLLHTGNAAQMVGLPGNSTAERLLSSSLGTTGTTAWVSFLIRSDDPITAGDYGGLSLGGINSWGQNGLFIGVAWNGSTGTYYMDRTGAGLYQDSGVVVTEDATVLLVVRLDFAAGNDTATLYINPTPGLAAPSVPAALVKNNIDLGTWSRFVMTAGDTNRYSFDELRVGATYSAVTPLGQSISGTLYNDVNANATVVDPEARCSQTGPTRYGSTSTMATARPAPATRCR